MFIPGFGAVIRSRFYPHEPVVASLVYLATAEPIWAALAHVRAWLNSMVGGMWFLTAEGLLLVLALVTVWRAWGTEAPDEGDARTFWEFSVLVVVLGAMNRFPVPIGGAR